MDVRIHFTPEGTAAGRIVQILNYGDSGRGHSGSSRPVIRSLGHRVSLGWQVRRNDGRKRVAYHGPEGREQTAHLRAKGACVPGPYFKHLDSIGNRRRIDLSESIQL